MTLGRKLIFSASLAAIAAGGSAWAQDAEDDDRKLDVVTVTGSFIPGTPEDAALPVDVLTAADLKLEGNPTITDLIKNLGVSSGSDGQTNQFASNGLEGTSNINLRGLGPARSLVLLNGRRQTFHPYGIGEQAQLFVNTNNIPSAAIGRLEVLKDGAAALYGSDAIAGVVNFITRDDVDGFEFSAEYSQFDGSDGDYRLSGQYGLQGDNYNWVTTVEYQKRTEVPLLEKDWAISSFADNPVGGFSSLSNPGYYVDLGNGAPVSDAAGCTALGGTLAPFCRFQFTQFDNLVEEEEQLKVFTEYNREINGGDLHLELLYSNIDVPEWKTSPSYPPQALTGQVVPSTHPGYLQYQADNPGAFTGAPALFIGRTFGWGGFPGTGGAQEGSREYDAWSFSGSYNGTFSNDVNYDFAATYSTVEGYRLTNDTYVGGLSAALNGFGLCADQITGTPNAGAVAGQGGCEYYNPFSNAIQSSAITGAVNPGYVAGLENSVALADWLTDPTETTNDTSLLVLDAVFSGESNVQAAGGAVGWAAGAQVRRETYKVDPSDLTDLAVTPGLGGTGPFSFLAGTNSADEDQTIYAVFGELQIPLFDNLDLQVAARFEDYGGEVGSTFDPKVAGKWTINDNFALRGNAQTSFRGPTLNQLSGTVTTLQFVAPTSAFKAVDQFGNPNLAPESAFSFNVGGLFENGNFNASIDYYSFDFSDPIIVEEQSSIVGAAIAALGTATTDDDGIISRITFTDNNNDGLNQANEISRISTNVVNGPDIETSGIDIRAENVWDMGDNEFSLAMDMTYILEYVVGDLDVEGTTLAGGDRVDQFNRSNFSRSLPQWKANVTANYSMGDHNFRGVLRHIDSYEDERGDVTGNGSDEIDAQTTVDLFYNWQSQWDLDLGLSIVNAFDEDPPFAAFDLNYDPYTHNPFGRTFKISVTKRFGGF
ncbi:MAG: TonB-dependent receptor [Henriciella sp.]|jgi:outer membrane receptor protein involved in Fe transport